MPEYDERTSIPTLIRGLLDDARDLLVVNVGFADCLFKNGRVGGKPGNPVLGDQFFEAPAAQQIAGEEIEPDRLTVLTQRPQGIFARHVVSIGPIAPWRFRQCSQG